MKTEIYDLPYCTAPIATIGTTARSTPVRAGFSVNMRIREPTTCRTFRANMEKFTCNKMITVNVFFATERLFELHRDKTNKMACAPSEDSDQPGLIRVFAVHLKKARVLNYPLSAH